MGPTAAMLQVATAFPEYCSMESHVVVRRELSPTSWLPIVAENCLQQLLAGPWQGHHEQLQRAELSPHIGRTASSATIGCPKKLKGFSTDLSEC